MQDLVQLETGGATLTGVRREGVTRFGALRYARAPIGALRFALAEPLALRGEVDATGDGPIPPQLPSQLARVLGPCDAPQSEDCLHLTVWTPAADGRRRPVLVWCHGGAWQSGGVLPWYDGEALARRGDVVVVAVGTRLGAPAWLLAEASLPNLGLRDLELAFRWVAQHIEHFGGDPGRVTAMGQSAGASNIAALLRRGPVDFHRAILQSAPLGRGSRAKPAALAVGRALLQAAGAEDLGQACELPVAALLRAQGDPRVADAVRAAADGHGVFCPVEDEPPFAGDAAGRVDVLIGWNRDEMKAFPATDAPAQEEVERRFAAPARAWAAQAAGSGRQAWLYRFDGLPGMPLGACHCAELPFVFGTHAAFAAAPMLQGVDAAEATRLTDVLQGAWLDFVHGRALAWQPAPQVRVFA